jgi:methylated-DNA-[protein]-cysteine S-methyltransferase
MMRYTRVDSPLGKILIAGDDAGLRLIDFQRGRSAAGAHAQWRQGGGSLLRAAQQLEAYFAGKLERFDLELAPEGTAFQRAVWDALRGIPYGETISYGELARRVGKPNASRAVGAANGRNPLPIVIPCHRVIGANGSLTGYGGGLEIKRALLDLERRPVKSGGAQEIFSWPRAAGRAGR